MLINIYDKILLKITILVSSIRTPIISHGKLEFFKRQLESIKKMKN